MGFFGALGKILEGKPLYGDGKVSAGRVSAEGNKAAAPVLRVTRVESPIRGNRLEVYITIRNESLVPVYVDKIRLLGVTREIDHNLAPGDAQEYPVYAGLVLRDDAHRDAELQYRTEGGDYFAARYEVRYRTENDGLHISELQLQLPIRDI